MQRKKEMLRDVQKAFDGLVLPGNILLYQYKSTPLLVHMCKGKQFFVDPMSYLFGQPFEEFKEKVRDGYEFKPSFERLMRYHGLTVENFIEYDYLTLLKFIDARPNNLDVFVTNSLNFQLETVRENLKKYAKDLIAEGVDFDDNAYLPSFLVPPYFLYEESSITTKLNLDILDLVHQRHFDVPIFPMLFVRREDLQGTFLKSVVQRIARYDYPGYCLWIENFRESRVESAAEVLNLIRLVRELSKNARKPVIMMFGGYFSLLLFKFGLSGICHGTLFSESRGAMDSVKKGAGPAPVRYYIRKLHEFFTLDSASEILKKENSLFCDCEVCKRVVRRKAENIANFQQEEALAEFHFLYNRYEEKLEVSGSSPAELVGLLSFTRSTYQHVEEIMKTYKVPWGVEERPIARLDYLDHWATAISRASKSKGVISR
jgi:hypothetical protein